MKKRSVFVILGILIVALVTVSTGFAGGGVVKSNGKDAAPLVPPCPVFGGAYCNAYQIEGAKGKVNLIQPNGNVDVILGISANGLFPNTEYSVHFDSNGGSPGPWIKVGTFWTDEYGSGDFNYTAPAGTYPIGTYTWRVYINRTDVNLTILVNDADISFEIAAE